MAKRLNVIGYKAFKDVLANYQRKDLVYCYFSGSKGEDGKSWCRDCSQAEPFVLAALEKYGKPHAVFILTQIGHKEEWRNRENPFRKDKDVRLTIIPTILRWKHQWRLESTYCQRDNILKKFFTEHVD